MTNNSELLPCLFCGGEGRLCDMNEQDIWAQVRCISCNSRGTEFPNDVARAVAAWNTRTAPPATDGEREAFEKWARPRNYDCDTGHERSLQVME